MARRRRASLRIGVDTGGTFTDVVVSDGRTIRTHKLPSTPDDPARAIRDGLAAVLAPDTPIALVHGSTVATNAVLEGKGATVALVTTAGFEDVIAIGRQARPSLYDFFVAPRPPLVDPTRTVGVRERLDATGTVLTPLSPDEVSTVVQRVVALDPDIVAVCLLHAYANPDHEDALARALGAAGLLVCTSSEVLPEYREYERWSTTVLNALVTPVMDRYLGRLEATIDAATQLTVMQSNGGTASARAARRRAIGTILSGPAGGVVGASMVAAATGRTRIVAFDMGGTSTDVSLVDGAIRTSSETSVGAFPVRIPVLDIQTIGAGGGSLAWQDAGGALRVGPSSAGADPGPACYGAGGGFTVTDANLLLGRLDATRRLGGTVRLDVGLARTAALALAASLSLPVDVLAEGVVDIANATMERAVRAVSIDRGVDPRGFTLVAFGGAGGMHACDVANRLGIREVLVPRHAGVLSALGMLAAPAVRDYVASVRQPLAGLAPATLAARFTPLVRAGRADLRAEGFGARQIQIARAVDLRYVGQASELTLPWSTGLAAAFHREHQRRYGYADTTRGVEAVHVRVRATGNVDAPHLPRAIRMRRRPIRVPQWRAAQFSGRRRRTAILEWEGLEAGMYADGPAIVSGDAATAVVPPGWSFTVDGWGNLVCTHRSR